MVCDNALVETQNNSMWQFFSENTKQWYVTMLSLKHKTLACDNYLAISQFKA
jgi:hypothetical protein